MTDYRELRHLLTEPLTQDEIKQYPTIGDAQERISKIMKREVWICELAYPDFLIEEYLTGNRMSSFYRATEAVSRRLPIIIIETPERRR